MHDAHEFLRTLAVVLCVAAVTTVVFQRLRQPVVFGYLLAGMIVGPHIPIPLVADEAIVETLSELGVILLLFSLGLEFSLRKLLRIGPTAGLVAITQSSGMVWIGYVLGQLLGWTTLESVFAGAVIAISSTTIIAKAFEEQRVKGRFTEIVFGVLIIALPTPNPGAVDVGAAPRRALVVTLQLAILAVIAIPIVAITLPFLPSYRYALAPLALVAIPAVAFWRSAMNLQGHAKAGAEVIAMKIGSGMSNAPVDGDDAVAKDMERVRLALPGLGDPVSVRVGESSPASDRTLAELNLRGVTGATVLAILRDGEQVLVPSGHDRVRSGDVLAVAGSEESVAAARELLTGVGA